MPLYDLFDSEFMGIIFLIKNLVKDNLKIGKRKFGNTTLSAWSDEIWRLAIDIEHAIKNRGKNYKYYEMEYRTNFINNKEALRYSPESFSK